MPVITGVLLDLFRPVEQVTKYLPKKSKKLSSWILVNLYDQVRSGIIVTLWWEFWVRGTGPHALSSRKSLRLMPKNPVANRWELAGLTPRSFAG